MKTVKTINWSVLILTLLAILCLAVLFLMGQMDAIAFKEFLTVIGPIFLSAIPFLKVKETAPSNLSATEKNSMAVSPDQKQSLLILVAKLVIGIIRVFFPTAKKD